MPRFNEPAPRFEPPQPGPGPVRRAIAVGLLALLCALSLFELIVSARPVKVSEAPGEQLACVSYAPFRLPGETPFDANAWVKPERIRMDLQELRARTDCVRTYSVAQGLDAVPGIAAELGMRVLLGTWIGRDRQQNELELEQAIVLASRHAGTVTGLIVGNEVLLRREQAAPVLAAYLQHARNATSVPVTYADVWEFWIRNPELARDVDFVTVHILPYWEDEPVAVAQAVEHVVTIARNVGERFAGKPLLIGETGWPSAGRQRAGAVPSRVNQAEFIRRFVGAAQTHQLDYNLIEAFDQPWKRALEGAMGGHWGLLDSQAQAKFPWRGPVIEDPNAHQGLIAAGFGAALALLIGFAARLGMFGTFGILLLLTPSAALLPSQWAYMQSWNRDWLEWGVSGAWTVLAVMLCVSASTRIAQRLSAVPLAPLPGFARALRDPGGVTRVLGLVRLLMLAGGAAMAMLLVVDPRYRGFPQALYLAPTAALLALAVLGDRAPARAVEERLLAGLSAVLAVLILIQEGLDNGQALRFGLIVLAMAAACWPRGRHRPDKATTA